MRDPTQMTDAELAAARDEERKKNAPVLGAMRTMYGELRNLGWADEAARTFVSEVGREGDFNAAAMYGSHPDHNNSQTNGGVVSWQGPRRDALVSFMKDKGFVDQNGNIVHSPDALRAQMQFADTEMQQRSPQLAQLMRDPHQTYDAIEPVLSHQYFQWDREGKYGLANPGEHLAKMRSYFDQLPLATGEGDVGGQSPAPQPQAQPGGPFPNMPRLDTTRQTVMAASAPQRAISEDGMKTVRDPALAGFDAHLQQMFANPRVSEQQIRDYIGQAGIPVNPGSLIANLKFRNDHPGFKGFRSELEYKQVPMNFGEQALHDAAKSAPGAYFAGAGDAVTVGGLRDGSSAVGAGIDVLRGKGSFSDNFHRRADDFNQNEQMIQAAHPYAHAGGEIAGTLLSSELIPSWARGAKGATPLRVAADGATQGGIYGFNKGEGGLEDRALNAGTNAAIGAVGSAAGDQLVKLPSRILAPRINDDVGRLIENGVQTTPGQTLFKPDPTPNRLGNFMPGVNSARQRSMNSYGVSTVNEVMRPFDYTVPKSISNTEDAISHARQSLGDVLLSAQSPEEVSLVRDAGQRLNIVRDAAKGARSNMGNFAPDHLFDAIDKHAGQTGVPDEVLTNYANAGRNVLGNNHVPDNVLGRGIGLTTGVTAGVLNHIPGAVSTVMHSLPVIGSHFSPVTAGLLGANWVANTRAGATAVRGMATKRPWELPDTVNELLDAARNNSRYGGVAGLGVSHDLGPAQGGPQMQPYDVPSTPSQPAPVQAPTEKAPQEMSLEELEAERARLSAGQPQ